MFLPNPETYHLNIRKPYNKISLSKDIESYKKQLLTALSNSNTLIISAEDLCEIPQESLCKFILFIKQTAPDAHIDLIGFTREHQAYVGSIIQQHIKGGSLTLDEIRAAVLRQVEHLYERRLGIFKGLDGIHKIMVFSFEEAISHANGPVGFFLDKIGVPKCIQKEFHFVHSNKSISMESVLFLNSLNKKHPSIINQKPNLKRPAVSLEKIAGSKFILDSAYLDNICKTALKDKIWLCDNFNIDYRAYPKQKACISDLDLWQETTLANLTKCVKNNNELIETLTNLLDDQKILLKETHPSAVERIYHVIYYLRLMRQNKQPAFIAFRIHNLIRKIISWSKTLST